MPDNSLSLNDILKEYSQEDDGNTPHIKRADAQKVINTTLPDPTGFEKPKSPPAPPKPISHERNELFDSYNDPEPPPEPVSPEKVSRKEVAVVNAQGLSEIKTAPTQQPLYSPPEHVQGDTPKIRRMSDSTRAKEIERERKSKKRKHRNNDVGKPYKKDTPDGDYVYEPPPIKKKKRSRHEIISEAESPENKKCITDIVPSPEAAEAAKPAEPAPRAEKTSIDLSTKLDIPKEALDVHIAQDTEEFTKSKSKTKRTKRIVDFNYYGDVQDVGRDIYELKEIMTNRVAILAITAFISLYITICGQFKFPLVSLLTPEHMVTCLLAHLLLGLLAVSYSVPVITKGLKNFFLFKADGDSMTAITTIACVLGNITAFFSLNMAKAQTIHIYMPVAILAMLINAIGKLMIIKRAKRNFNFVSRSFDRHAVVYVRNEERAEKLTRGTSGEFPILAAMRKTDFLTDFLRYSYSSDIADSFAGKAAPLCLISSLLVTIFLTFFRMGTLVSSEAAAFGMSIFSMMICTSSCIALPFTANIPLEKITEQTLKHKGVMLGYQSVDDLYDVNSVLVDVKDLFPEDNVKLGGIQVFSNTKLNEALLEAASLANHGGSIMKQIFGDMAVQGRTDALYHVENFSYEEDLGLCGWINNKRVLLGNRELMENHNIEGMPSKSQESEYISEGQLPIYLSISGNVAALFSAEISSDRNVRLWAGKLTKKKIYLIVKSVDPFMSLERLSKLIGVSKEMIRIIPQRLHEDFDEETKKATRMSASMACTGKFSSMAELLLGTKCVHNAAVRGLIVQTVSILLGLGLCMLLILSKAFEFNYIYMSATAVVIYNIIASVITCFAVNAKKP